MSALNCFNQGDRLTLTTDGGFFNQDRSLAWIGSKVVVYEKLLCAWAMRGASGEGRRLERILRQCGSFDDLVGSLVVALETAMTDERREFSDYPDAYFGSDLTAIGWSERDQALQAWKVSSRGNSATPALTLLPVPMLAYAPDPTGGDPGFDVLGMLAPGISIPDIEAWNAFPTDTLAGSLIDAQRRYYEPEDRFGRPGGYVVAGFAETVTVYRDRIERTVIRRWSDVVGAPIDPLRTAAIAV